MGVALKLEKDSTCSLSKEAQILQQLARGETSGIPKVHWHGLHDNKHAMVIELLGKSLSDLFMEAGKSFTTKTLLMLAERMITRLEHVHSQDWLHRDIKPD